MEVLNSLGPVRIVDRDPGTVEVEMAIPGRALGGDILRDRGQDWEALGWESLVEGVDFGEVAREVLGAHPAVLHQPGFERGRGHVRRGRRLTRSGPDGRSHPVNTVSEEFSAHSLGREEPSATLVAPYRLASP